jgi:cobalt-zinc-cadmium efflux system protein
MQINKIFWIIIFNIIIILNEITFGVISNSFSLISDALHNVGDVIALVVTFLALKLALSMPKQKSNKIQMKAAFFNTLFLYITMLYMIYESISKLYHPEIIEPIYMIVVGFIAFIANAISAYILFRININCCTHNNKQDEHKNLNIQSAYLHMLSDALISIGVVIAGVFIYYFNIVTIDSILTILFSLYILKHSYPLLKKSFVYLYKNNKDSNV